MLDPTTWPKKSGVLAGPVLLEIVWPIRAAHCLLARGDIVIIIDEMNDYYNIHCKETSLKLLSKEKKNKGSKRIVIFCRKFVLKASWPKDLPYVYIQCNTKRTTLLMDYAIKFGRKNFVLWAVALRTVNLKGFSFRKIKSLVIPFHPTRPQKRRVSHSHTRTITRMVPPVTSLRFYTLYGPIGSPDMAPYKFID